MRRSLGALILWLVVAWASPAHAFPWMIRHSYTGCAQCHVDPSGAGALTSYGRAQEAILLQTQWVKHSPDWEPGKSADFLFGLLTLPKWLTLQVDGRSLVIPEPSNFRYILMQADLRAAVDIGALRAYASAGYANEGAQGARITSNDAGPNLISREHWIGFVPTKGLLVRAGRMALPFGIRTEEHVLFTRSVTRTDLNKSQQHGLDVTYGKGDVRAEVMGIAGNFQASPDAFRERGYAATVAWSPASIAEIGVSSLVTHAELDVDTLEPRTRQAHGVFGRVAPIGPVVVMAEADLLRDRRGGGATTTGAVGVVELDVEPIQGVHVRGTGEWCDDHFGDDLSGVTTGWLSALWFVAPRADLRVDALRGTLNCTPGLPAQTMGLLQVHYFL